MSHRTLIANVRFRGYKFPAVMKLRMIMLYGILAFLSLLICSMVWHWHMAGNYFLCKHNGVILDFLPPFIHAGQDGDFYIRPINVIYTVWSIYMAVGLVIPAIALWLGSRLYDRDLKKSWM